MRADQTTRHAPSWAVGGKADIPLAVRASQGFDPRSCHALSVKATFSGQRTEDSHAPNLGTFLMGQSHDPDHVPGEPVVTVAPVTPR